MFQCAPNDLTYKRQKAIFMPFLKFGQAIVKAIFIKHSWINPQNSLRPKTGRLLFGQLVWRKIFFFQFFLLDEWTTYFTSFPWTPSTSNSDSIWAYGDFLFKTGIKLIFREFSEELLHAAMWLKLPKGWRAGCSKNSLFCP
jgi:hypothetical protein